ncbi:hypothetical protein CNR22_16165 [Sphingobacteriaceae bacterium]|nr:hypothetical protein CNR22_16165 [Sphingobacteriaceae bacterium]
MIKNFFLILFLNCALAFGQTKIIFSNVNVVDVENGSLIKNTNVIVEEGKIKTISPDLKKVKISKYKVIDCSNKYMVPGYIDSHAHLPSGESPYDYDTYFLSYLANGVTSLRVLRFDAKNETFRDSVTKKKYLGTNLFLTQPPITKFLGYDAFKKQVDTYKSRGYDFVKYLCCLNKKQLDSISMILNEKSIPLVGHVHNEGALFTIQHKFRSLEHLEPFVKPLKRDSAATYDLAKAMKENNTFICPTYFWYYYSWDQFSKEEIYAYPELEFVPASVTALWKKEFEEYEASFIIAKREQYKTEREVFKSDLQKFDRFANYLNKSGVKLLVGSDDQSFGVPGFAYHREIAYFKNAGIPNADILKGMTSYGAECLSQDKTLGKIKENYKADLVILNDNPLDNTEHLKNISAVVKSGDYYEISQLRSKLKNAVTKANGK